MRQKSVPGKEPATQVVKNIRRATRRHFSAEDKIPHCTGRPARRGQYRRALPPRGDRPEPLLSLVERLSRGVEEATVERFFHTAASQRSSNVLEAGPLADSFSRQRLLAVMHYPDAVSEGDARRWPRAMAADWSLPILAPLQRQQPPSSRPSDREE
jgi:hypothetical protein